MALTVLTNSYVSLEDAEEYFANYPNSTWDEATDDEKIAALIRGARYLDLNYDWKGYKVDVEQLMEWPRRGVTVNNGGVLYLLDQDTIPDKLVQANCEAAVRHLAGTPLLPDSEREVIRERVEGAVDVEYAPGQSNQVSFREVDRLVSRYVYTAAITSAPLIRA